ncbi:MAG: hypothetical protein M3Y80_08030 [Verrucomicrobiota bacterium]|nr:hypothetical protein [Verrucomicrobiota bacterium]
MSETQRNQTGPDVVSAEQIAQYCAEHPRSPAAVRRPKVMRRGRAFIALLGSTLEDGIAGIGNTVEQALVEFDLQYSARLRPPRGRSSSASRATASRKQQHA